MLMNFFRKIEFLFERLVEASAKRPFVFLGVGVLLCGVSVWALNSMSLSTSRAAVVSNASPEVQRFEHYMTNFDAASDMIIAIEGVPRKDLEEYTIELSKRLEQIPEVSVVDSRLDLGFFVSHSYTLLTDKQFDQVTSFMNGLLDLNGKMPADMEAALKLGEEHFGNPPSPSTSNLDMSEVQNHLNKIQLFLDEWLRWLEAEEIPENIAWGNLFADQPEAQKMVTGNGFYDSHDGKMLFMFVRKAESSDEYTVIKPFYEKVKTANEKLKEEWKAAGRAVPTTGLIGNPSTLYEEYSYLMNGVRITIAVAGVLIFLIIMFVMRSFKRGVVVFAAMGIGSIWSFSFVYLAIGHLSMVTEAFTAVLFGLGIDYGVFISSRIIEEMKHGASQPDAIRIGTVSAAKPVIVSGFASILIFGALGTVEFPGFSELGIVGAVGVLAVQISTFTMLPALYSIIRPRAVEAFGRNTVAVEPTKARRVPRTLSATLVILAVIVAGIGAYKGLAIPFDYDAVNMLPADSDTAIYSKRMMAESDYQLEVVVMIARSFEEARKLEAAAKVLPSVAKVLSPMQFFPEDAPERAAMAQGLGRNLVESDVAKFLRDKQHFVLPNNGASERIAVILDDALLMLEDYQEAFFNSGHGELSNSLDGVRDRLIKVIDYIKTNPGKAGPANQAFLASMLGDTRSMVEMLGMWKEARVMGMEDLPPNLQSRFLGKDGSIAIYVYPAKSVYDLEFLKGMMADIYKINPVATGFPTTHNAVAEQARSSFFQGTLLALIVALIFLFLVLHNIPAFLVAALPLLVGGGFLLGILAILNKTSGYMYNYVNMLALPLLMALSLDYGVWFAHRVDDLRQYSTRQVIQVAGAPIIVAALTTIAGIGALSVAEYRGLSTLGLAVTIGLICSVTCALVISPAIAHFFGPRRSK